MATPLNDTPLITQLRQGDKQALFGLYDKYSGALYGVIIRICKREDMAKDVLQESFLKIWRKIDQYDASKGKFYTWAYRIAKNTALNAVRNPDPLIQTDDLSVYDDRRTEVPKDYTELNGMLKQLEPHHQRAIELVYFEGFTHREAHKEMKVPLGTFKSYVRQALLKLREQYPEELMLLLLYVELIGHG
ncbi:RNA polymerase sigma factor [Flavobacteriaceae bacterium TP-CH-4]|uniref:RNA polymerase sigma factor n=1 Tax=Pelagihabitans pacificus TaxID=2696054 RepID=A0A967AWR5_9FLAO|nr:RNA polymerase sigma factor [Pelagihabitans pacificus]NHF61342.1 RNA polymerase sigma factor [Pelagihabitans pacificus]